MKEQPNYYGIIPAAVRYSKDVSSGAKLLYCELTALTNATGECWASNGYFANLYGKSNDTISRWIAELNQAGFIRVVVEKKDGTKRYISIVQDAVILPGGLGKNAAPVRQKCRTPLGKNAEYNIIENNTNNIVEEKRKKTKVVKRSAPANEPPQDTTTTTDIDRSVMTVKSELMWQMDYTDKPELNAKLTEWAYNEILQQLPAVCAKHGKSYTVEQLQAWVRQQLTTDKVNVGKTQFTMYGEPMHSDTVKHLVNRCNWQLTNRGGLDLLQVGDKAKKVVNNYSSPF